MIYYLNNRNEKKKLIKLEDLLKAVKELTIEACDYYGINFDQQQYMIQGWFNINYTKKGKLDIVVTDPEIINSKSYDAITLAFDEDRADERKEWLRKYKREDILEYTKTQITKKDTKK